MVDPSHLLTAKLVNLAPVLTSRIRSNSSVSLSSALNALMVANPLNVDDMWVNMGERVTASSRYASLAEVRKQFLIGARTL